MIYIFCSLASLLIYLSFDSLRGGIGYIRFFHKELAKPLSTFTPFATIIAPCKGVDQGMELNLRALFEQDYPLYEVIFVVDDAADPAVAVIRKLISAETGVKAKLVVAGKSNGSGQKVENHREALLHVNDDSQIFAFVDSDTRPSERWLSSLAARLDGPHVGASTGYRWFISTKPTFASELRSVWNASIASSLGPDSASNFCWGGSMAIRRDVFDSIQMREKWRGTLSDDLALTRELNNAGLPIVFVPQAMVASVENCKIDQLLEFTTRQIKITRVYATRLWALSFAGSGLFNLVMIAAFLIVLLSRTNGFAVWTAIATLVIVSVLSIIKAWLRLRAIRLVLPQYDHELRRQTWTQLTLWTLSPAIFFYNAFAASISRRMTWRGITYELKSPHETVIISD